MSGQAVGISGNVLVLVGDAQSARIVRPGLGSNIDVVWEGFARTPKVSALNQAPDFSRNSEGATRTARGDERSHFAHKVAGQIRSFVDGHLGPRLLVITPESFAQALRAELGAVWPSRKGDVIYRDETKIDDEALHHVIKTTLEARP